MITAESERSPLRSLSGGNQQKVILARWLRRQPRILLLDEPTQGVDVGARAEIYELVHRAVAGGAAALVASSDLEELAGRLRSGVVLQQGGGGRRGRGAELDADRIAETARTPRWRRHERRFGAGDRRRQRAGRARWPVIEAPARRTTFAAAGSRFVITSRLTRSSAC